MEARGTFHVIDDFDVKQALRNTHFTDLEALGSNDYQFFYFDPNGIKCDIHRLIGHVSYFQEWIYANGRGGSCEIHTLHFAPFDRHLVTFEKTEKRGDK